MRATRIVPIAAASALLMMGCSGPADEPEAESPTPTTEAPSTTPEEFSEPEESGEPSEWDVAPSEDAPLLPGDEGPAEAGEGDAEDASNAAHDAVEAFLDTEDPEEWWERFSAHLTPAAQEVWQYTAPGRVPAGEVEGSAEYGQVSATDAEVTVPTTLGDFHLVMVRESAEDDWMVSYMEPPEEAAG